MGRDRPEVAAWKAVYQNLDNSALLALVPILDTVIEQARREFESAGGYQDHHEKSLDFTTGRLQQAMVLREQGVDVSEYVAETEKMADDDTAFAAKASQRHRAMFAYLTDLRARRYWISNVEVCRRGLLTDPGEFLPPELRFPRP